MNYLLGAFKPACHISILLSDEKNRRKIPIKKEHGQTVMVPLFQSQENVSGLISVEPIQGKKIEHNGIKVELLGQIEMYSDRSLYDFTSLVRELDVPGELYEKKTFPFEFSTVEMPYETYGGVNVRLRYVLKVTISRGYGGSIHEYQEFVMSRETMLLSVGFCNLSFHYLLRFALLVGACCNMTEFATIHRLLQSTIALRWKLESKIVYILSLNTIRASLSHILSTGYNLKDVIIGKIYFLLVRIKIKNMDLEIRRRESTGSGATTQVETETLAKFELMDGAPVRGESIPIRLFLGPYDLTPTYRNINNKFSVKYFLNLVLVDEEDRRYFKQQEITLYRSSENQN